jgi:hypothetical protein
MEYSDGSKALPDTFWPEFPQLTKLRLEHCVFFEDDLSVILPRNNTKLKCLELFDTDAPFASGPNGIEIPVFLTDCLEELWIENCQPIGFETTLRSYTSLQSLHVDSRMFSHISPFIPDNLRKLSIAVPISGAGSGPDFLMFEITLLDLSTKLHSLEAVTVSGYEGSLLLRDPASLEHRLRANNITLTVKHIQRNRCG